MVENIDFDGRWKGPKDIGSATIGTAWADVGSAFKTGGVAVLAAYLGVNVNLSNNMKFRLLGYHTPGGTAFSLPIKTAAADIIKVEADVVQLTNDADQDVILSWGLDGIVPLSKLQTSVGSAGGTAATLDVANIVTAQ